MSLNSDYNTKSPVLKSKVYVPTHWEDQLYSIQKLQKGQVLFVSKLFSSTSKHNLYYRVDGTLIYHQLHTATYNNLPRVHSQLSHNCSYSILAVYCYLAWPIQDVQCSSPIHALQLAIAYRYTTLCPSLPRHHTAKLYLYFRTIQAQQLVQLAYKLVIAYRYALAYHVVTTCHRTAKLHLYFRPIQAVQLVQLVQLAYTCLVASSSATQCYALAYYTSLHPSLPRYYTATIQLYYTCIVRLCSQCNWPIHALQLATHSYTLVYLVDNQLQQTATYSYMLAYFCLFLGHSPIFQQQEQRRWLSNWRDVSFDQMTSRNLTSASCTFALVHARCFAMFLWQIIWQYAVHHLVQPSSVLQRRVVLSESWCPAFDSFSCSSFDVASSSSHIHCIYI